MGRHGAVKALGRCKALRGVLALLGVAWSVHVSAASAKLRGATPRGTIWIQNYHEGEDNRDPNWAGTIPHNNLGKSLVRSTILSGLHLRSFSCYGITCDPRRNLICFARGRSDPEDYNGQSVFYLARTNGTSTHLLKRQGINYARNKVVDIEPRFMPNGDILFNSHDRIAIMNREGKNLRFLTGTNERCGNATVSRDVRKVAFESNGLWVMSATGRHRRKLLSYLTYYGWGMPNNYEPLTNSGVAISPNGKLIAYSRDSNIYVLSTSAPASKAHPAHRISGRDRRFRLEEYINPVWSPNGKYLAVAGGKEYAHDVYLIEVATGKTRRLTARPQDEIPNAWVTSKS